MSISSDGKITDSFITKLLQASLFASFSPTGIKLNKSENSLKEESSNASG
jgi:hypothetical protein